jgi:ribose 5-phosphate isomerase A
MDLKQQAASRALEYIQSGMVVGIGTGSTTAFFIDLLGERLKSGMLRDILAVPTSEGSARRARELGIPLTTLFEHPQLDIAVDGADEVDPAFNLIKGLGRALLREKVVESHARQFVVIVDESKIVSRLGTKGPLPVEIIQFEAATHIRWLNSLGCRAEQWLETDGSPVITDNGNFLVRCWFENGISDAGISDAGISDAYELARTLAERPGIVEHGLFLDMANRIVVAGSQGIQVLEKPQ